MKKLLGALVLVLALCLACTAFAADGVIDHSKVAEGTIVNWGDLESITTIDGHKVGTYKIETPAKCNAYGKAIFECKETKYGIHQHYVLINKLPHKWSSDEANNDDWGKVVEKPTCQQEGLAVDVCTVCGTTNENHTRVIEKTGHEYSKFVYDVFKAPKCNAEGLGQHKCIYCGELNKNEVDKDGNPVKRADGTYLMEVLPATDHDFTDWNILTKGACGKLGTAERACVICGMHQLVDGDHMTVWLNNTEKKTIIVENLDDLGLSVLNKLNEKWGYEYDEETDDYVAISSPKTFDTQAEYEDWLKLYNASLDKAAKVTKNWLIDCYTREITLSCPYCCKDGDDTKSFHKNIKIKLTAPATIAHTWNEKPLFETLPSCTEPGYKVFTCIYDHADAPKEADFAGTALVKKGDTTGAKTFMTYNDAVKMLAEKVKANPDKYTKVSANGLVKKDDHLIKVETIPALGHKWGSWSVANTFTKDGVKYVVNIRICDVCGAKEEELKPLTAEDGKNGLVQDEETGDWYFYEADKLVDETKIVEFEGGEFWIVKGKLAKECMGLVLCADKNFYFLNQGQILRVSEIVEYDGGWFIVKNGELDLDATGLYTYDGGRFLFTAGRLRKDVSGLVEVNGTWYFLANGQVADYTGVAEYDGEFFVIDNGLLDADYNGTIEYDGKEFKVVDGQLYALDAE
jgi:hypothetical protein